MNGMNIKYGMPTAPGFLLNIRKNERNISVDKPFTIGTGMASIDDIMSTIKVYDEITV